MRVVHVIECFASGASYFVNLLTQHISDCEHVVIHGERADETSAETEKMKFPAGVTFMHWKSAQREIRPLEDLAALIELIKLLKQAKGDVIHLHSSKAGFVGRLACNIIGIKHVIYTPNGASFARTGISTFKRNFFVQLEKLADRLAGKVVCCSNSEAQIFKDIKINASYINNGTIVPEKCSTSSADQSNKQKFTVVTCGRISDQKNPEQFNEIAQKLLHHTHLEFIWVGDGEPQKSALLNAGNIKITGWLSKQEVLNVMEDADLYLSTALWEGLPLAVLEAMSLGKPLLLSKCIGNVDLVKDGFNGYGFEEAQEAVDKIIGLSLNRARLKAFGLNSRKWCETDFNVTHTYAQYAELYHQVLQRDLKA